MNIENEVKKAVSRINKQLNLKSFREFISRENNFVLWGASQGGRKVKKELLQKGKSVICFVDSDREKWGKEIDSVKVIPPTELLSFLRKGAKVLITSIFFPEISNTLEKEFGLKLLKDFSISPHVIAAHLGRFGDPLGYNFLQLVKENIDKIGKCYESFADAISKVTFKEVLKMRIYYYELRSMPKLTSKFKHYIHPKFRFLDREIIVDGGAFDGDTVNLFKKELSSFRYIYAFEPDEENFNKLTKQFSNEKNVVIEQKALWNEDKVLYVKHDSLSDGLSSYVEESGKVPIDAVKLDSYFKGKEPPTFIKLDIEGSEIQAIYGSREIILHSTPKLAISIYHKPSDLWDIPLILKGMFGDRYDFFLGHHESTWQETVLYCKPKVQSS